MRPAFFMSIVLLKSVLGSSGLGQTSEFARWTVTCTYPPSAQIKAAEAGADPASAKKAAANALNTTTTYTKAGDIRLEETVFSDGGKQSAWHIDQYHLVLFPGKSEPNIDLSPKFGRSGKDFPGFEWISAQNFTGIQKPKGESDCLVFESKISVLNQVQWQGIPYTGSPPNVDAIAYVNVETRLPLALKIGEETRTFRFTQPPTGPLAIPPAIQAAIDAKQKKIQAAQVRPPRP
jgi:hypothetical protein